MSEFGQPPLYVPVLARKPGALRNGAPFKDWVLPPGLERIRRKLAGSADGDRQMVQILTVVLSDGLPAVEAASGAPDVGGAEDQLGKADIGYGGGDGIGGHRSFPFVAAKQHLAASRGRASGGAGGGKAASQGPCCTEPERSAGGGSWVEGALGERRGKAPRPPSPPRRRR
jgi:hypothetical protein